MYEYYQNVYTRQATGTWKWCRWPSFSVFRVHHQGRPPKGTHLSPLLERCMGIISATFGVEWHGKIVHGLEDRMCVCVCVCGNGCCSVIQQSVAPRQLQTNVAVKWIVALFLLLKAWWSIIIPRFKKTYLSKLGNILQYTLKLSIPYAFSYSNYFFNMPTKCTYTIKYMYYINTVLHFFLIKPTRCTNFINLFWHETLHVSDSSSVHHQEFIRCTLSNGLCHTGL